MSVIAFIDIFEKVDGSFSGVYFIKIIIVQSAQKNDYLSHDLELCEVCLKS